VTPDSGGPIAPPSDLTPERLAALVKIADSYRAGAIAWRWLVTLGSVALGVAAFFYYLRHGLFLWLQR